MIHKILSTLSLLVAVFSVHAPALIRPLHAQVSAAEDELWFGKLNVDSRVFRFAVTLTPTASGEWTGKLQSLDEGGTEFPINAVQRDDGQLSFEIQATAAKYQSEASDSGESVNGRWIQRGADFPLNFARVTEFPREKVATLWVGQINAVIQKLDVAIRELETGEIYFDSVSQKAGGFVVSKKQSEGEISFEVPGLKATFKGTPNADGTEIVGKWRQGIIPLSLTLKKSDSKVETTRQPNRPQTPKAPFPYDVIEVSVSNPAAEGVTLAGTLTIPNGLEHAPAVILISGSGPQDRDESILGHKPFWVLADHLSRNGIAVLRFDDRGIGQSQGDFASATSVDFASDVSALVKFLQQHERIDPQRVGLCGHSEGGLVAPMVAADDPSIAGIVMLAGPGVNGEKILLSQSRLLLEASGVTEGEIERQGKSQQILIELAKRTPALSLEEFMKEAREAINPLLTEEERDSEYAQATVSAAAAQLMSPWFRYFLTFEPQTSLSRVTCPVLALNGEKDLQVDPKLNLPAIETALQAGGLSDYQTVVLPDLNHLFQKCETGTVSEYAEIEETLDPQALDAITNWLSDHFN